MGDTRIRILCVDDHPIVREGLTELLTRQPDMEVVGVAATANEAVEQFSALRPDVTLMDLQLGTMSGVDAIRTIRDEHIDARIVVLTVHQGDEDVHQALEAGAIAFLLKDTPSAEIMSVIRQVAHGRRPPIRPEVGALLESRASRPALTRRELQVLRFMSDGLRNKEIATACGIHEETVKIHVKNILDKLDAEDRTGAVSVAIRRGLIHLS